MRSSSYVTILSAIACFSPSGANTIVCTRVQRNATCFIEGLSLQLTPVDSVISFPSSAQIIMKACEILHFSTQLFDALTETAFLTLKGGFIPSVAFQSESLHSLRVDNTGLREFTVGPRENRNLNTLIISGNPLTAIPSSIRHLTALSILDLSNNQLEYVALHWLQPMGNLLALDLSSNRIIQLDVQPTVRLGRLKNFWINHNRLRAIAFFPSFVPALQRVRLVENLWSCSWVTQARGAIWTASIQVYGAETVCSGEIEGGLCCYAGELPERSTAGRYEIVSVSMDGQDSGQDQVSGEILPRPAPRTSETDAQESQCTVLRRSYDVLGQKYRRVVEEKDLLEKRFVNTVRELEGVVRRLTGELSEAQNVIRLNGL